MDKIEEREIEDLAQKYFASNQTDKNTGDLLVRKINKAVFVSKIFWKQIGKHSNLTDDPDNIRCEGINRTIIQAFNNYKPDNGSFINYFSVNFKFNIGNVITEEIKKQQELGNHKIISLDASIGDDKDTPLGNLIEDDKNKTPEREQIEDIDNKALANECRKLFSSINKFYLLSKAGQKNKSVVYTYIVLEYLLSLYPKEMLIKYIEEYDFLQPQKDLLSVFWDGKNKGGTIPTQDEYAKITGTAPTKFAGFKIALTDYLKEEKIG